jgi:hypothetical protein
MFIAIYLLSALSACSYKTVEINTENYLLDNASLYAEQYPEVMLESAVLGVDDNEILSNSLPKENKNIQFVMGNNTMNGGFCVQVKDEVYFIGDSRITNSYYTDKLFCYSEGKLTVVFDESISNLVYDKKNNQLFFERLLFDYEVLYYYEYPTVYSMNLADYAINKKRDSAYFTQIYNNTLYCIEEKQILGEEQISYFIDEEKITETPIYDKSFLVGIELDYLQEHYISEDIDTCLVYEKGVVYVPQEARLPSLPYLCFSPHDFSYVKTLYEKGSILKFVLYGDLLIYIGYDNFNNKSWGWINIETSDADRFNGACPDAINASTEGLYFTYKKDNGGVYFMNNEGVEKIADFGGEGIIVDGGYIYVNQLNSEAQELHLFRYNPKTEDWLQII